MRLLLLSLLSGWIWLASSPGWAEEGGEKGQSAAIAVIDFDYLDTSGEPRDQHKDHEARIRALMAAIRGDLAKNAHFRVVTANCGAEPCASELTRLDDLVAAARAAGASVMLIGGVHKMSTLVQWAKIQAIDVKGERIMLEKLFTFRGDSDEAWRRAESFIAEELNALPQP